MTTANIEGAGKMPLGVGQIIGDSFSIFFTNIVKIMLVGFVPVIIGFLISGALLGFGVALGTGGGEEVLEEGFWVGFVVSFVLQMAIYSFTIALLVQLAYDAKLGNRRAISEYFGPAVKSIIPIVILGIVFTILLSIGFMLLVVPGLWILAVLSVTMPAIVIDKAGFGGFGRSAFLTKEYRWPIVGALIIMYICTMVISVIASFIMGFFASLLPGAGGIVLALVVAGLLYSITYGLTGISISLIYARLREIKEGVSVDQLAAVFD